MGKGDTCSQKAVAKKPNDPQEEPAGFGGRSHLPGDLPSFTTIPDFDQVV